MRIGVDVGGTNTDAVLMDGEEIKATCKTTTTEDVSSGITTAIDTVLKTGKADKSAIDTVMIGTTHFTNAFVERKHLLEVGVIRIALPAARLLPPMIDWPADMREKVCQNRHMVRGGYQFDGRENVALDEKEIATIARDLKAKGIYSFAVAGVFCQVNSAQEERAAEIIRQEVPDAVVTLSHNIGRIGLIERENAAVMNASLAALSSRVVTSFREALTTLGIDAPFYISQNDGTLMSAEMVEHYPVLTFASGPTNSMRGAAYLCDVKDAIVADIGGTTTDIGVLANGFPRESSIAADVGGVRTNFRMPDITALGLGGGSLIAGDDDITVGPQSVGYRLVDEGLVFGGDTLTATDIAVASGQVDIGDGKRVARLSKSMVKKALDEIHQKIEIGIDRMKTSADPVPLILVGGGSILVSRQIAGTTDTITPDHAAVANAIGAAIAQIGGEIDRVFSYEQLGREAAIEIAGNEARQKAVEAGAVPASIEIVELEELPLTYMPGGAVRLRAKAVGDLTTSKT